MIIHQYEHVPVTTSVESLEGTHNVAMHEPSYVRGFVPGAFVGHVTGISLDAVLAGLGRRLSEIVGRVGSQFGKAADVVSMNVQTPMHSSRG